MFFRACAESRVEYIAESSQLLINYNLAQNDKYHLSIFSTREGVSIPWGRAGMGRDFVPGSILPAGTRYHSILDMSTIRKCSFRMKISNRSVCPLHTCAWEGYETVEIFVLL